MRYLLFSLIVCLLGGCTPGKPKEVPHVSVAKAAESVFDAGKEFASREMIFLETTPQSLLGHISKVVVGDKRLYVFDKNTNSVVIFDRSGKYVAAIRPSGKGPGEYFSLGDFTMDLKDQKLILLAQGPEKILVYGADGKFEYEMFYNQLGAGLAVSGNELIVVNMKGINEPYLNFVEYKNRKITEIVPSPLQQQVASDLYTQGALITKGEEINFARRFDNTLYTVRKHEIIPRFYLDFGEANLPSHILNLPTDDERQKEITQGNYVYTLLNIKETPENFFISANKGGFIAMHKSSLQAFYYKCMVDLELGVKMGWVVGVEDEKNEYVGYATNRLYLMIGCNGKWEELTPDFREKVLSLKENSNPILFLYKNK